MLDKNELFKNSAGCTFRLLEVTRGKTSIAHVLGMDDPDATPKQWPVRDLTAGLQDGEYCKLGSPRAAIIVNPKPKAKLGRIGGNQKRDEASEEDPSDALQRKRWEIIEPLVTDPKIYWRGHRGKLVAERAKKCGCSKNTVMLALRLYWRGGSTSSALRGNYAACGTPKVGTEVKRERPPGRKPSKGRYQTYVWAPDMKARVLAAARRHLRKGKTVTHRLVYTKLISKYFSFIDENNKKKQRPLGERPSRAQIYYLVDRALTLEQKLRRKNGDDNFEENVEEKTGDARKYADTVGQYYEIDSTIPDIEICADDDPSIVIGKAVLYLIVDAFSRLIVGFLLTLDKPSWAGALEAMMSLVESKEELCSRWGFDYRGEDWPAHGLWPAAFRADRGSDFMGYGSDTIAENLDTTLYNLPKRRASKKGTVECSFKLTHVSLKDNVGGYTAPGDFGKRQTEDPKQSATRTLKSVGREILEAIRFHNHRVHRGIRLPPAEIYAGEKPIPSRLWKLSYESEVGALSRFSPDYLRFKLLPSASFKVTPAGLFQNGLLWEPERALKKQWLLPASQGFYDANVTYDRRLVDVIYVHDTKDASKWTTMHLTDRSSDYMGMSWAEYESVEDARLTLDKLAEEHNLALEIELNDGAEAREAIARRQAKAALLKAGGRSRTAGAKQIREAQAKRERAKTKTLATTATPTPASTSSARATIDTLRAVRLGEPASASSPSAASPATTAANAGLMAILKLKKTS